MLGVTRVLLPVLISIYSVSSLRAEVGKITEQYGACGENCLFAAAMLLKRDVSYGRIRDYVDPAGTGETDLAKVEAAATLIGLSPVGLHLQHRDMRLLRAPAILQLRGATGNMEDDHFVLYLGRTEHGRTCVLDPPRAPNLVSGDALRSRWSGYALVVCANEKEARDYKGYVNAATRPFWAEPLIWSAIGLMTIAISLLVRPNRGAR